jgi:Flp pilus assembly protein TadD
MTGRTIAVLLLLALEGWNAPGESLALVRDPTIVSAQGYLAALPVTLRPVAASANITVVLLSDTLTAPDIVRARRELTAGFSSAFLAQHTLRFLDISSGAGHLSEPLHDTASLQSYLKRWNAGTKPPASLTELLTSLTENSIDIHDDWSHALVTGRFPEANAEERQSAAWMAGWIADYYRNKRVRMSFWTLDVAVPAWAQDLSQSTQAAASETLSAILPALESVDSLFEASWRMEMKTGAWPSLVVLKNKAGERTASLTSLCAAANFTPPFAKYIAARAAAPSEKTAADVLALNPADGDALKLLAALYKQQKRPKEAYPVLRTLTEINPSDGAAWADLAETAYVAEAFDESEAAFGKASALGINTKPGLQMRAALALRRNDFSNALARVNEAIAMGSADQALFLLRADCAHGLRRWPIEAESLEKALALGPLPLERSTALIAGYLAADQPDRALGHLARATMTLPNDAAIRCRYAAFWEQAHDDAKAAELWKTAIEIDGRCEAAYVGLAANELRSHHNASALDAADHGLAINPKSATLLLTKEQALEATGEVYAARRLLAEHSTTAKSTEFLERRSRVEDWYGVAGADAYSALLAAQTAQGAPRATVVETCRRGLAVAIRDERPAEARAFAEKLAANGDHSGLDLLTGRETAAAKQVELPGGVDAFYFLLFGKGKPKAARLLADESRLLVATADAGGGKTSWQSDAQRVHEYFQRIAALTALGQRKKGHVEITLTLNDKPGKQRTEKVFSILGLKLKRGKEGPSVKAAEGKDQARKQDTLAALAIDDQEIQQQLAAGKTYVLEIPMDTVPVFPSEELWRQAFYGSNNYPGGMAEALVTDPRMPRLYLALNSMDVKAATALVQAIPLRGLAERYSEPLAVFSSALAIRGGHAEVPGGTAAEPVWQSLTGGSPARPVEFFQTLLSKDEGRLIAYFYTLSQLDSTHQKFFTRSAERAKRFYSLFRDTPEMRRGVDTKLMNSSFTDFLRNIPLNDDGSVDFPGSPEVWMVAKGHSASTSSVGKMTRKLKKSAAPDDEDEILIRLANTAYKAESHQFSELANFIAVTQIDEQRDEPLSVDSALLLAQGYAEFRGLFPYFAALGDLETADYQSAFSFKSKLTGIDQALANVRAGEFHSVLAMLGLLHESGLVAPQKVTAAYRACITRYLAAADGAAFTQASLSAVDDLTKLMAPGKASPDNALRLLLTNASAARQKRFNQVLALQKTPSLDGLLSIRAAAAKVNDDPGAVDEIQRQLAALTVIPFPKSWKLSGDRRKYMNFFDNAPSLAVVAKMRERLAKKKRNPADVDKLSAQLLTELEPWVQLALTGRIYARFLDPSDMLVSEDAMLLRKHEFISLDAGRTTHEYFPSSALLVSSESSGSRFEGGLAEFSLTAGEARAAGNHMGGPAGAPFAKALLGSVREADWRGITPAGLASFSASVRLAREWIVASATSTAMRGVLEAQTRGILSINRRNALLDSLDRHDWPAVWRSASISDLHFLGDELLEQAPKEFWNTPALQAMKAVSAHSRELDVLGSVAPELSGCGQSRLRRYAPYEEYQRHLMPGRMAERLAELKLYLAWMADASAWQPETLSEVSYPAADLLLSRLQMHDMWDWDAVLEAFRSLKAEELNIAGSQL